MPPGREKDSSVRFHRGTRKARYNPRGLFLSPSLFFGLSSPPLLPLPPHPRIGDDFFELSKPAPTGEDNGLHRVVRPSVPHENGCHQMVHDQMAVTAAVSSFLADHYARATFAKSPPPRTGTFFTAKPPRGILLPFGSPAVAFLVNRYDGLS